RTETGIKVMIKDGSEFQQTDITYSSLVFIRLFDYDEDGFLDLFAATYTTLSYALNDGNGNFQEFNQLITYDNYINDFRFADMDNDDDNDIIVYASGVNMYCHINNGSGDYSEIYNIDNVNSNITSTAISIVDIDDDGFLDIVLAGGFYLKLFHNHGDNTFDNIVLIDYYSIEEVFLGCRVGDLDLDGDKDIVYKLVEEVYWLENFGYEFSHLPIQICNSYNDIIRDESYRELFLSDIDNDGCADIVTGEHLSNQLLWQKNYFNQLKISGDVFFDENQDGVRNEDEQGFLHSQISLSPSSLASYTNQMGNFWFAVDEGDYLVEYQDLEFWGLSTAYENYNVEIGGSQNNIPDTCDFGFFPEFIIDSLDVDIVEGASICGNYTAFWLNISNYGTTMPSGIIELDLDPAYTILYSEEICDSVVNNKYYWSYEDLDFFGNINFPVYLNSPPIELIGNTLTSVLSVYVLDDEENIVAFSDTLMNIFTCAYDPNDKIVRPCDETGHNFIEPSQELEYIIRFQNTGNDTALNIYIYDYIETDLNRVTFELMSSSHSVYILRDNNQLTFRFDSIMLPDSGANQLLSNGYVKYRISPIDELNPLTVINNTAYIYFDFNNPIQTNTTVSTISCWINPEVPIIEVMENLLFISGDSFYYIQWYLNGSPIIGANDMYYSATSSGDYSVEVFNEFGCANWSGIFPFVYNSIKEDSVQRYVYPNPFTDELYIDLPDHSGISIAVLTDIKGAVINKFIITEDLKNLSDI
ncbi:MAG: VCBS repeat-containing protein, partial [Bacteroidales bacterium]|nr:VCBS repeat-containing protein [Bacteroidales bacterium]